MAARELSRNYDTRYCVFYIDSTNDISSLPTSKESGKNELLLSTPCSIGSTARDVNGKTYTLNGSDKWVVFTASSSSSSSGSGGEIGDSDVATDGEVDDMLDDVFFGSSSSGRIDNSDVATDDEVGNMLDDVFA